MTSRGSLAAIGMGAGLAYFLDPDRGAQRRARMRDKLAHTANLTGRVMGATSRDALHRTQGTFAALRTVLRREDLDALDDDVLVERVRAKLGRLVSHPGAIQVTAWDGTVALSGPILKREVPHLLSGVSRVAGVRDVIDNLEVHEHAGNVPSLQGGRAPLGDRLDVFQDQWSPTTRCVVGTAGAAIAAAGVARRDLPGGTAAAVGAGMVALALTNLPLSRLTGIGSNRRAVDVQKTIFINAPVGEVYAFWSLYESFPKFMSRVLEVRSSENNPNLSHWKVAGPAGAPIEFDAEIRRAIPNQMIAWRTLQGSPVAHAGIVRFDPEPDGRTRVQVRMSYNPPAGWIGHGVAAAFGVDPKSSMDADLLRMKTLIETGRAPRDAAERRH
jgi:uncharacterized membrane protein